MIAGTTSLLEVPSRWPGTYSVHPHAAIAYLEWFAGDTGEALSHAMTALTIDEDCSLAAIVVTAIGRGIRPASQRE